MDKTLFKIILIIFTLIFISAYLIASSGYYEYTLQQKTILTNEKIKQFEQDIKANKEIDLETYLDKEEIDYSNKITTIIYSISDKSNKLARKTIKYIFKKIGALIED